MQLDAALISYGAGNGSAESQMFWGTNTTTQKVDIDDIALIPYDQDLCQSGSGTGLHCGFTREGNLKQSCNTSGYCTMIVQVESTAGGLILGQGDSGGPVYYPHSSGNRYVVGIVKNLYNGWACGSANYFGSGLLCTNTMAGITPISKIMDKLEPKGFVPNVS